MSAIGMNSRTDAIQYSKHVCEWIDLAKNRAKW
jgi:hypothetical protein